MDPGSFSNIGNPGSGRNRWVASRPYVRDFEMDDYAAADRKAPALQTQGQLTFKALIAEGRTRATRGEITTSGLYTAWLATKMAPLSLPRAV